MKSIRIIDKNFNLVGEIDCFESFSHTRRFRGSGGFDLRVELNDYTREYFKKDNIIIFDKNKNLTGIVEHSEVDGTGRGDFSQLEERLSQDYLKGVLLFQRTLRPGRRLRENKKL